MPPTPAQARRIEQLTQQAMRALGEGQYERAHALATEALEIAPGAAQILAARASAGVRLRRYEQAEEDITRAIRRFADHPVQWLVTLALVRRGQGRLDEALEILRGAQQANPRAQIVTSNLAEILSTTRRHEEAYGVLRAAIDGGADRPGLLAQFGRACRSLGKPGEALDLLREAADRTGLNISARKQVLFELGHVLDRLGEFDDAFDAFSRANALETRVFDIDLHGELTDDVRANWTRGRLASLPRHQGGGVGCVLIVGMRRSGTTLNEQIFAAHPDVVAGGELRWLRAAGTPLDPKPMQTLGFLPSTERLTPEAVGEVGRAYDRQAAAERGDALAFTDKMPANAKLLGLAQLALPECRVVWCRRNPIDTCLSCFMQPFNDNSYCCDLRILARYFHDCDRLMRHWAAELDLPLHACEYERLVAEPEPQTRALLEAGGIEFDEACLRFHESDRAARTASTDQVGRELYGSSVERWHNYRDHLAPLLAELHRLGHDAD